MNIDINECDLNDDYFHFTNQANVNSILENGLRPALGPASDMVGDRPNVSVSKGAKGIMGIVNSFIHEFSSMRISQIPDEFKKYFSEITDFNSNSIINKDLVCIAMIRKLKDEVYFKVNPKNEYFEASKEKGLTGFDINSTEGIDKSDIRLITSNGKVLSAYDLNLRIYEKVKDIDIFREFNEDYFYMFEMYKEFLRKNISEERENEELTSTNGKVR